MAGVTLYIMPSRLEHLHRAIKAYAIIFVFWGLYRLVFRLPEAIEETILKPIVFVGSVFFIEKPVRWDKYFFQIWGGGNCLKSLFLGLGFGAAFLAYYALASFLSFGKLEFGTDVIGSSWITFIILGIVTAIWEEWFFTGYIFRQLKSFSRDSLSPKITTAILFSLIHLPILAFVYKYTGSTLVFQLLLLLTLGFGNTILIGLSRNLLAPILSHTLWGIAIFLFR